MKFLVAPVLFLSLTLSSFASSSVPHCWGPDLNDGAYIAALGTENLSGQEVAKFIATSKKLAFNVDVTSFLDGRKLYVIYSTRPKVTADANGTRVVESQKDYQDRVKGQFEKLLKEYPSLQLECDINYTPFPGVNGSNND